MENSNSPTRTQMPMQQMQQMPRIRPMAMQPMGLLAPMQGGARGSNPPTLGMPKMAPMGNVPRLACPFQPPAMQQRPIGIMQPQQNVGAAHPAPGGKQQLIVQLEVQEDFEPCLELKYDTNKPVIHLSANDSLVNISAKDAITGQTVYHAPLQLPLRFPNLHFTKVDYTNGARVEVTDCAMLKAPITKYTGEEDPTIRLRSIGTSGRVGFIDRGTSPKHNNTNVKPPKVGEGFFDYTVTLEEEILAEVSTNEDEAVEGEEAKPQKEMFVVAKIILSGVITASVYA